jgi:protein TonB
MPKPVVKQSPPPEPIAEPIPEPMPAEVVEEALPVELVDTQSLPEAPAEPVVQDDQVTSQEPSDALAKGSVAPITSRPHHDPGPSDWDLRMINERIRAGLKYPAIARRMGWEGTVRVSFVICYDGTIRNVELVESSGSPVLDKNALKVINEFPPFPGRAREARVVVPIVYDLRDAG